MIQTCTRCRDHYQTVRADNGLCPRCEEDVFVECETCAAKPGSPTLCPECIERRARFTCGDLSARLPRKKAAPPAKEISVKIEAIASVPRLGWQDNFGSVFRMLSKSGIALSWYTTAFWHKGIHQAFVRAVDGGVDWILSLDYDTVFDVHHLEHLLAVFGNNPQMDALAAIQPRRGTGAPLMTVKNEKGEKVHQCQGNFPIKAFTAHFGFTLIRCSALKAFPKPWFIGEPDADGDWGETCIDPDIYFWKKWAEHGKTLYVDPRCRVGHLEVLVSTLDDHMVQRFIPVSQWREMHADDGQELGKTETKA